MKVLLLLENLNILLVLDYFFGTIAHKKQELYEKSISIIIGINKTKGK